eukprot:s492_g8.t1
MRSNNPARTDLTGDPMGSALWSQLAGDAVKWPGNVPVTSCYRDQISTSKTSPWPKNVARCRFGIVYIVQYCAILCNIVPYCAL